ncbi:inhibitor of vertebrate lysozyme family protein [Ancylobacter sp. 6x-1]|uniref:Inhibitor of vertebrate lysozyme family protein n=1 Tax=Ancylobacter crimeensis TaxID=2579147 RepID=A0ABT0DEY3_9HYPH|nr:Ivy family c-type lysozyme inhibitor [Ancylobacter crimeensis]MCK0198454.1 inhibitor of vertebrate lysozyme family protein [Ancylobacter crimeensis]
MAVGSGLRGFGRVFTQGSGAALLATCLLAATLFPARAQDAAAGRYLFDAVKVQPWRGTYAALVRPIAKAEPWVVGGRGVGFPSRRSIIEGRPQELFGLCKPHDCADNQLVVLFAPDGRRATGAFRTPKGMRFLGQPDEAARRALVAGLGS